jgi:hypothetical protein
MQERILTHRLECRFRCVEFYDAFGVDASIVSSHDDTVYLVNHLGRLGAVWREANAEKADLEAVIADPPTGQYKSEIQVIAFNTAERVSQDIFRRFGP